VHDFAEHCEDSNVADGDGCDANCGLEAGWTCSLGFDLVVARCLEDCGDTLLVGAEECDEGSGNSDTTPNACRTDCRQATCGDGVIDAGELCDDGEANSNVTPDGCMTTCTLVSCGDGKLDPGDQCDDGPDNSDSTADACRTTCVAAACGDEVLDGGETCDQGQSNSDVQADACRKDCQAASCGDGVVDSGEECDEGTDNVDGVNGTCNTSCVLPTTNPPPTDELELEGTAKSDSTCGCRLSTAANGATSPWMLMLLVGALAWLKGRRKTRIHGVIE